MPGLDGIRALAVTAVFLYHAELAWVPGGFLGVEVFFVLSGYLITSLLWSDVRTHGRPLLRQFYLRRARRLLPAVLGVLGVVTTAFVIGWPQELGRIRGDVLAALGYGSNWYQIATDQGYFGELTRPSPFRHLWSLAIEEQFYLAWPAIVMLLGRRRSKRMAGTAAALAMISAALMWATFSPSDPTRAYLGTDTRAFGLLVGASLAFVWRPWEARRKTDAIRLVRPVGLDAMVVVGLAVIGWYLVRADEFASSTFVPGIQIVALATAFLIAATTHPRTRAAGWLGHPVMQWLGKRSYSIYLWHWPVFVLTRPGVDLDVSIETALLLRIAITIPLAEASYRFVERPIREGGLGRVFARIEHRMSAGPRRWRTAAGAGSVGMAMTAWISGIAMLMGTAAAPQPSDIEVGLRQAEAQEATAAPDPSPSVLDLPTILATLTKGKPAPSRRSVAPVISLPPLSARVEAVGDSVMLGGRAALKTQIRGLWLNAATARRVSDGIAVLRRWRDAGTLAPIVVVHLGNNGALTRDALDQIMNLLRDVNDVLLVTVKVPRRWERQVNATLRDGARRYPSVTLVDWHARWRGCPGGKVFASDGYHLTPSGARCYADVIAASIPAG